MKLNKLLSMGICATSLLAIAAPMLAQTVSAANADATLVSGSGNTATATSAASGSSQATVGFDKGDLILYQVPSFNFNTGNKIRLGNINMKALDSGKSDRIAVVMDNRSTTAANDITDNGPWHLNVTIGNFVNDADSTNSVPIPVDLYSQKSYKLNSVNPDSATNLYSSSEDGVTSASASEVTSAKVTANGSPVTVAKSNLFGVTGISFNEPDSATLVIDNQRGGSNVLQQLKPGAQYTAKITWNLSADPTSSASTTAPASGAGA